MSGAEAFGGTGGPPSRGSLKTWLAAMPKMASRMILVAVPPFSLEEPCAGRKGGANGRCASVLVDRLSSNQPTPYMDALERSRLRGVAHDGRAT